MHGNDLTKYRPEYSFLSDGSISIYSESFMMINILYIQSQLCTKIVHENYKYCTV